MIENSAQYRRCEAVKSALSCIPVRLLFRAVGWRRKRRWTVVGLRAGALRTHMQPSFSRMTDTFSVSKPWFLRKSGLRCECAFAGARHCGIAAAILLSLAPVAAEDTAPAKTGVAIPSVEELAIPDEANNGLLKKPADTARESDTREAICLMIESAARASDLPLEFFARVIWQESRFQSDAVGPVTRSGQRAQGIAQFMPGTANERRLLDPFDPVQALPKSAEFLERVAQPVRQSWPCRRRLQCRSAPGAGMAGRHRSDAAGDPQLCRPPSPARPSMNGQPRARAARCRRARRRPVAAS